MKELTEEEVREILEPEQVIEAVERAFRDRWPATVIPARMQFAVDGGVCLIMPCQGADGTLGMKLVVVKDKPAAGEERVQASYFWLDSQSLRVKLAASANYLTDLRTAAASAVATKFLAREDAKVLGVFGTGRQARAHIEVLPGVRRFEKILVCGKDANKSKAFAKEMSGAVRLPVAAAEPEICAGEADVICTCTTSQTPLFHGAVLRPGTHLNLVGAFQPHAREVDSETIRRARLVVDTYEGALAEAGDLLIPISEGVISRQNIAADLHELLGKNTVVRTSANDITLFKSVGCALEDLATFELLIHARKLQ